MRVEIRREIESVTPLDQEERAVQSELLEWIDSGVELCRIKKPATPPMHLCTYFVLVDGDYILFIDHVNSGLWLPPGGHVDPGEHPRATVLREAQEELSIDGEFLHDRPLFLTINETVGKTGGHIDVCIWYTLQSRRETEFVFDRSEFSRVKWFHKNEVPMHRTDRYMERFLKKLYPA
ncbi:MAG: NUDIX domain-containing protein [Gammaproteobacteria bacterium]